MSRSTKVQVKCTSKKQAANYGENPLRHEIELEVPYDQKSVYFQMSGGTTIKLNTVSQDAAYMFIIGEDYDMVISPAKKEEPVTAV